MRIVELAWRAVRGVLLALAAFVLLVEEWGWRPLTAWATRLAAWWPLAWLEAQIKKVRPGVALALFLVPALLLFPLKLLALWLIQQGRVGIGVTVIIAAKVLGTAFAGRLFILLEPQLMQFSRFVRAIAWWRLTKLRVKAALRASAAWQAMRRATARWRERLRRLGV